MDATYYSRPQTEKDVLLEPFAGTERDATETEHEDYPLFAVTVILRLEF